MDVFWVLEQLSDIISELKYAKMMKNDVTGNFWASRVTIAQTVNWSLLGQPMNYPSTVGAYLGSPHVHWVVGSVKNAFYAICGKIFS